MKLAITVEDVKTLSLESQQRLSELWEECQFYPKWGDDQVDVYLVEEDERYFGHWDQENEFEHANYIGKLYNYDGTIVPLLNIGQMMEILLYHDQPIPPVTLTFCDDLWQVLREWLETDTE